MSLPHFVWGSLHKFAAIPGSRRAFVAVAGVVLGPRPRPIPLGPAKGLLWRHRHNMQPWMTRGPYEPATCEVIGRMVALGDVFYDVGANAGNFSLHASRIVGPTGGVIAFEPVPETR